jgi:hypothetical protein
VESLEPLQELSTPLQDKPTTTAVTTKAVKTSWKKGQSGNPRGRPPTASRPKDIVTLKNDLELAVRDQLTPTKVTQIVNRVIAIALDEKSDNKQALSAAKIILDMSISKAAVQEAVAQRAPINIIIENATLAKQNEEKVIEAHYVVTE